MINFIIIQGGCAFNHQFFVVYQQKLGYFGYCFLLLKQIQLCCNSAYTIYYEGN